MDLRGRKVTVMGLGRFGGGLGAAQFALAQGALATVTDLKTREQLADSVAALERSAAALGSPVTYHLGGHVEQDFCAADLVIVSPAVPKGSPYLALARAAGVALTSEMNLFLERCPAPVAAVTGSAGKSTTAALLALALAARHRVHFGGNIGRSLLADLPDIQSTDRVCLEISSFQLEDAAALRWSPRLAVVTNISPNHLDRHGTMAAYVAAKQTILRWQGPDGAAVLNADDGEVATWGKLTRGPTMRLRHRGGRAVFFSVRRRLSEGAYIDGDRFVVALDGRREEVARREALGLPGLHNAANFLAAALAARLDGVTLAESARATRDFAGLPHRLCLVGEFAGVRYFDDSKATTPASAQVALAAFDHPVIAIAGGYDKKIDLAPLAQALAEHAKAVMLIGQTAPQLAELLRSASGRGGGPQVEIAQTLQRAMERVAELATPGDVVLLSPGHASWDQFESYEERGRRFAELARCQAEHAGAAAARRGGSPTGRRRGQA